CDPLKEPDHGSLECNHPLETFSYNSSCTVQCEEGYEQTALESVYCTSAGVWSGPLAACKVVTCPALEMPAHGAVNCFHPSVGFTWGTTCEFTCEEGFTLTGPATLQCGSSGTWDRQPPSFVECEPLSSPEKGFMDCSHGAGNFTYNTTCHFSCLEGWRLNGSHELECSHSGNWSATLPTCEASEEVGYISVGIAATSASLLSTAMLLFWLAKRF
ncbi:LYAM2 protein, partial [Halcyon senegalensis]|nr:LYAM2 protein [Halcyon senegalensis]